MNGLVPISKLFNPVYGVNLELLNLQVCDQRDPESIRFIARKDCDNGLSAYVKRIPDETPNPGNTISVAVSGSVLSSFYQSTEYYSGRDIYYLFPRFEMSVEEMLFYAFCLEANKYKYNYGRGANRTLKDLLVPEKMPTEFRKVSIPSIELPIEVPLISAIPGLNVNDWGTFTLDELFHVKKGKRLTKENMDKGSTPFIGAIDSKNGYREFVGQSPIHSGNTITVNYNGSVAKSFYQPLPFWASDDVNVLYPKFRMNIYIALFILTIIEQEKFRFNYGRKWHKERMEKSAINLPTKDGKPDFVFMENYIKSLPYSRNLSVEKLSIAQPMVTVKRPKIEKGLSDEELVKKYESGGIDFGKTLKPVLQNPKK